MNKLGKAILFVMVLLIGFIISFYAAIYAVIEGHLIF